MTLLNSTHYIALTWKAQKMLIINRETLKIEQEVQMPSQISAGWGITHSDDYLFVTDGSNKVFFLDKTTL